MKIKTVFIPDKAHKQNFPSYQHKACAPIGNISHIVFTLLQCGLQRNDQYITYNLRFFLFFCRIVSESNSYVGVRIRRNVRRIWIPAIHSLPSF